MTTRGTVSEQLRACGIALGTLAFVLLTGCASLTNDPNQQVSFKAPGCKKDEVSCVARNKRGQWSFKVPSVVPIRRSDDPLVLDCEGPEGLDHKESIPSRMGGKIVASAVFLDFGITDSITDKHREYPAQVVLQMCD